MGKTNNPNPRPADTSVTIQKYVFYGTVLTALISGIFTYLSSQNKNESAQNAQETKEQVQNIDATTKEINIIAKALEGVPIGSIIAYSGNAEDINVSNIWKICDGRTLQQKDYPELATKLNGLWGNDGTNSNTIYLPDLQGMFLRGVDGGKNDPDITTRKDKPGGKTIGGRVGSYQEDAIQDHKHRAPVGGGGGADYGKWSNDPSIDKTYSTSGAIDANVSSETRPENKYVYWIIRVK